MILSATELNWVNERMKIYDIKYQEIYNELLDHVLTAMESKRTAGDTREIAILFQDVVDEHFGGYQGVEAVAKSNEKAYNDKVKHLIWTNFKHYLNPKTFALIVAAILMGYILPAQKTVLTLLASAIVLTACFAVLYAFIELRPIKPSKGKASLAYSYIILQASLPMSLFNFIVFWPQIFSDDDKFNVLTKLPTTILSVILAFTLIYTMSCVRLCRQELKSAIRSR